MNRGLIQQLTALALVAGLSEESDHEPTKTPPTREPRRATRAYAPRDIRVPSESPVAAIFRAERIARKQAAWDARQGGRK